MINQADQHKVALVTGATGYVGSRLITELIQHGWAVRAFCRNRGKARSHEWFQQIVPQGISAKAGEVEIFEGDASKPSDLKEALQGIHTAWYLLHSMDEGEGFQQREKDMASHFSQASEDSHLKRIVYLSGLHPSGVDLSRI